MKADRSHPQKRKRSEGKSTKDKSGELSTIGVDKPIKADVTLKFNKYKCTKQDNSVSDCIPSGLPKSTLAQFHENMRLQLDKGEMQDCKECGEQLDSQTMSI